MEDNYTGIGGFDSNPYNNPDNNTNDPENNPEKSTDNGVVSDLDAELGDLKTDAVKPEPVQDSGYTPLSGGRPYENSQYYNGNNGSQQYGSGQYSSPQQGDNQYGNGQYGSGQYGSPQQGDSRYGNGQYSSPQQGDNQYGNGQYGSGQYGSPQQGNSQYGNDPYGNSQQGNGQYGNGQYGNGQYGSGYGDPAYGGSYSAYGNPYYDNNNISEFGGSKNSGYNGGFGIASLILGIVSIVCCCTGINLITGVLSIIFGIIHISKHYGDNVTAIIGIITSGLSLLAVIISLVFFVTSGAFSEFANENYGGYGYYNESYYDYTPDYHSAEKL